MATDAISIPLRVTNILELLDVPYFIGESLASTLYGMVRTTQDSDIIADLRMEHVSYFLDELQNEFYMDENMIVGAIPHQSSFNIIHRESMFKVDVFIPSSSIFTKSQFSRARKETLSQDPLMEAIVASPEDILLAKLAWYRLGGEVSERQWRDVLGVVKVQADELDRNYLGRTAAELQIKDLLERVFSET